MFENVLSPDASATFGALSRQDFLGSFYLAGGTGCALQIGHCRSQDIDFFSPKDFEAFPLQNALRNLGLFTADYSSAGTLIGRLDGAKISLFHYPYPLLEDTVGCLGGRVASLVDIGCMKIDARTRSRDVLPIFREGIRPRRLQSASYPQESHILRGRRPGSRPRDAGGFFLGWGEAVFRRER